SVPGSRDSALIVGAWVGPTTRGGSTDPNRPPTRLLSRVGGFGCSAGLPRHVLFRRSEGSGMADGSQLALGELPEREASLAAARPARANAAFWFGVASLVTWLVPTLGLPVSAVGLMLAIRGRRVHA